jgi:two-component system OmpR family sensor kinase
MGSIRTRITLAFAGAFMASLLVFALAILLARRQTAMHEVEDRARREVERTVLLVRRGVTLSPTARIVGEDTVVRSAVGPALVRLLETLDADTYVLLLDASDGRLFASARADALELSDRDRLEGAARGMTEPGLARRVSLRRDDLVMEMRQPELESASEIHRVIVAVSARSASLAPRELVATMLLVGPLLIGLAVGWAYLIAGRAFQPIDRMVDQVQAITDGRSLHRRLAIGSAGGELVRLAVTLNEMIERLETSFGALRRFTADASHELKTPLAVLRADVERAMSPTTRKDERAVALEEALEQVTRMAELVNSLLTLARADEGRLEVVQDPIVLDDLAREIVETARLLGEEAGVHIESPALEAAAVRGDIMRLRQLCLNLVTNAIKYTPRGGTVTIALTRVGPEAHFSVKDTGIGIAAADLPYIFDRFWRADRSRSRAAERGGFGLGLAICQWIAHAHGGSLTVQSRLGRGSTFTAQLPLAPAFEAGEVAEGEMARTIDRGRGNELLTER